MDRKCSYITKYDSPLGSMTLASDGEFLTGLWFDGQDHFGSTLSGDQTEKDLSVFRETKEWLDTYFSGKEPEHIPNVRLIGTDFRKEVWSMLIEIPYGETVTYGEIAKRIAREKGMPGMSSQAVGNAVANNPILLIVPCHRVIGKDGKLTGYAGGIDRKEKLLKMEKENSGAIR